MKKNIKVAFVVTWVLLLSFTTASVLMAQAENYKALLGTWDVELTDMGMQMEFVFKMDGETLMGEMIFDMGGAELEDISLRKES